MNQKVEAGMVTALAIVSLIFGAGTIAAAETISTTVIKGTLDSSGNVLDGSGRIVGHVVLSSPTTTVDFTKVTVGTTGDVIDSSGRLVGRIISPNSPATTTIVKRYALDPNGIVLDTSGQRVGYVVYNTPGRTYEINSLTIDANGNVVDVSGAGVGHIILSSSFPTTPVYFTDLTVEPSGIVRNAAGDIVGTVEAGARFNTVKVSTVKIDSFGNVIADGEVVGRYMERVAVSPTTTIVPTVVAPTVAEVPNAVTTTTVAPTAVTTTTVTKYRIDAAGNVIDSSEKVIGFVAPAETHRIVDYSKVTVEPSGNVIVAPGVVVGHVVIGTTATDLFTRRTNMETRISEELTKGNITPSQASRLRAALAATTPSEARYRRDGIMSDREVRSLYSTWDRIMSRLDSYLASNAKMAIGLRSK